MIFEHELIHLVLSLFVNEISGHGNLYKTIVLNLFGHTDTVHTISSSQSSQSQKGKSKSDFALGNLVSFSSRTGKISGKIIKLNPKRARVSTNQGNFDVLYQLLQKL